MIVVTAVNRIGSFHEEGTRGSIDDVCAATMGYPHWRTCHRVGSRVKHGAAPRPPSKDMSVTSTTTRSSTLSPEIVSRWSISRQHYHEITKALDTTNLGSSIRIHMSVPTTGPLESTTNADDTLNTERRLHCGRYSQWHAKALPFCHLLSPQLPDTCNPPLAR